jgi:hypothetical protein
VAVITGGNVGVAVAGSGVGLSGGDVGEAGFAGMVGVITMPGVPVGPDIFKLQALSSAVKISKKIKADRVRIRVKSF